MSVDSRILFRLWEGLTDREDAFDFARQSERTTGCIRFRSGPPDSRSTWTRTRITRVARLRQAMQESGPLAQRLVAQKFAGIDFSDIWSIFLTVCKEIALTYGGATVAGAFIGGIGGAFLGGVGAVPGAAAGATAGGYVGGWVLALLGLKSLVEGVVRAVPQALECYERGLRTVWDEPRQDHLHRDSFSIAGGTGFAAHDFADGHVLLVSAMLAMLVAYLTRGRGDRSTVLAEISDSRLGPKVASWLDRNEEKLRRHPALESRAGGPLSPRQPPVQWPPQLKRGRRASHAVERSRVGMPKKAVPCFKAHRLPQGSVPEFDRQLAGQEAGINRMTVQEYLDGRAAFKAGESKRDSTLARLARTKYQKTLRQELANDYVLKDGCSLIEAEGKAEVTAIERMRTLAALHTPDMVAGGRDLIGDFGEIGVNKSIGAQWNKGHRLAELDRAARAVPESMRDTKMNVSLKRCK